MAGAKAFCIEMGRNVTIFEARDYYLGQPEPRQNLSFLCGDDRCRALLRPAVIGENYRKPKDSPDKKKSPCFRENIYHPHIANCTWIAEGEQGTTPRAREHNSRASQACAELGLVFRPYPGNKKKKAPDDGDETDPTGTSTTKTGTSGKQGANGESRKRPETNRFMAAVAMIHLNFTTEQKRTTPLVIEDYADGTFHTICNWVGAYHPNYYSRRIYLGRCKVKALDKAMIVKFWGKISLTGDRNKRTVPAEISLSKTRLNNENADLLSDMQSLSDSSGEAWCYFFSDAKPTVAEFPPKNGWQGKTVARFSVASLDHIAVIPVSELTAPELAEHEP